MVEAFAGKQFVEAAERAFAVTMPK